MDLGTIPSRPTTTHMSTGHPQIQQGGHVGTMPSQIHRQYMPSIPDQQIPRSQPVNPNGAPPQHNPQNQQTGRIHYRLNETSTAEKLKKQYVF